MLFIRCVIINLVNGLVHQSIWSWLTLGVIKIQVKIDKGNKIPLYLQLKKQIMDLVKEGALKVGYKMPTERELSEELKISRNTVSSPLFQGGRESDATHR